MRDSDPATVAALFAAREKGIVPRGFFWATVKDRTTGAPVEMGFWTGDYPVTLAAISGVTGLPVMRTYAGGVNLEIGNIPRVSDFTIWSVDVSMSAIAPTTQQLVYAYDARLAKVEIHTGLLDPATRELVAPPEIDFIGEIDEAPVETGAVGGESRITLKVRSDAILMLTRTNPRKRSYEGQCRRKGDQWGKWGNSVQTWRVSWGEREQA